ncbi:MAG: hypothetical protein GPJ54_13170 [Candidatus Heimdallarchaeota archaeon]|nr:hypothetical protein [Candidatus Heimdallarchaeota archaeon]
MVEKFLVELFRRTQKQKIAIIVDGRIVSDSLIVSLPNLVEKLREIGDIKIAEVIYETKIPEKDYEFLTQIGFTNKVVPSNLDLNLLSQTYDLILSDDSIDTLVLGTDNDNLLPLVTELRKNVTIFALTSKVVSKAFEESFDGIIEISKIDDFHFTTSDISEVESIIGTNGDYLTSESSSRWVAGEDDANISPISDDLEEQSDLEEELKIQDHSKNGMKSHTTKIKKPIEKEKDAITKKKASPKTTKKTAKKITKKKVQKKSTKKPSKKS